MADAIRASRAIIMEIVEEALRTGAAAPEKAAAATPPPREALPPRRLAAVPGTPSEPAEELAPETEVVRGLDMGQRVAMAERDGATARAILQGAPRHRWPSPLPRTVPPLRNRVWVVLRGRSAASVGLFDRWASVAAAGGDHDSSVVCGFASLTEAKAFSDAAGFADLPDRR